MSTSTFLLIDSFNGAVASRQWARAARILAAIERRTP